MLKKIVFCFLIQFSKSKEYNYFFISNWGFIPSISAIIFPRNKLVILSGSMSKASS